MSYIILLYIQCLMLIIVMRVHYNFKILYQQMNIIMIFFGSTNVIKYIIFFDFILEGCG